GLLDRADSFAERKGIEQSCDPVGTINRQTSIAGRPDLGIVELEGICVETMKPPIDANSHKYFCPSEGRASRRAPSEEPNCQREGAALPSAPLLPRLPEKLLSALTVLREIYRRQARYE